MTFLSSLLGANFLRLFLVKELDFTFYGIMERIDVSGMGCNYYLAFNVNLHYRHRY